MLEVSQFRKKTVSHVMERVKNDLEFWAQPALMALDASLLRCLIKSLRSNELLLLPLVDT